MSKIYQLEKSPLYRMRNRTRLAEKLNLPANYFRKNHEYEYSEFSRPKANGDGERHFTVPPEDLKKIQKQICKLLNRIETPEWVISGKKAHSYVTNAERHRENKFVKTMDISKFYDSAQRSAIYKMFTDIFKMEKDIAWIMTDLVTYKGVLPTGSPTSQLIVYWTYSKMFQEIKDISEKYGCIFSLYVDDMTFSSNFPISATLRMEVSTVLKSNGLMAKMKKDHYYQSKDFKVITGVGINKRTKIVQNCKRKNIIDLYERCKKQGNIEDIEKLNGTLCSLRQIEPNIFPEIYNYISHYKKELRDFSKQRYIISRRKSFLRSKSKEKNN